MGFDFNKHGDGGASRQQPDTPDDRPDPADGFTYHPRLYRTTNTVIETNLGDLQSLEHDEYGQTIVLPLDKTEVVEGAIYDKDQSNENDPNYDKKKLFSFDSLGYGQDEIESGDVELHDLPTRYTETAFGDTYTFHFEGARLDGEEPLVYEDVDDPLDLGTVRLYFGTSSSDDNPGPKSESKRVVRLLAENGVEALNDENFDSIGGWADSNVSTADDLLGKRVRIWTVERPIDDNRSYNHLMIEDVQTEEALPVRNNGGGGNSGEGASSTSDDAPWEDEENDGGNGNVPEVAQGYTEELLETLGWAARNDDVTTAEAAVEAIEKAQKKDFFSDDLSDEDIRTLAHAVEEGVIDENIDAHVEA